LSPRFGRELIALHAEQAYALTLPSAHRLQRAGLTFTNAAVSSVGSAIEALQSVLATNVALAGTPA
jgi:hypothetical protein